MSFFPRPPPQLVRDLLALAAPEWRDQLDQMRFIAGEFLTKLNEPIAPGDDPLVLWLCRSNVGGWVDLACSGFVGWPEMRDPEADFLQAMRARVAAEGLAGRWRVRGVNSRAGWVENADPDHFCLGVDFDLHSGDVRFGEVFVLRGASVFPVTPVEHKPAETTLPTAVLSPAKTHQRAKIRRNQKPRQARPVWELIKSAVSKYLDDNGTGMEQGEGELAAFEAHIADRLQRRKTSAAESTIRAHAHKYIREFIELKAKQNRDEPI